MTTRVDDDLWSAVGDPSRRRILDLLLVDGQGTATSLSGQLPVTRQAVAKHLAVLGEAGLVAPARHGRETRFSATLGPLTDTSRWLAETGAAWDRRLDRLAARLSDPSRDDRRRTGRE